MHAWLQCIAGTIESSLLSYPRAGKDMLSRCKISSATAVSLAIATTGVLFAPQVAYARRGPGFVTPVYRLDVSVPSSQRTLSSRHLHCGSTGNFEPSSQLQATKYDESGGGRISSKKQSVALTVVGSYSLVTVAAKLGILPGPMSDDGTSLLPYTDALIGQDLGSSLLCAVLAIVFVQIMTTLAKNGTLMPRDSRKLIHSLSAPLFMLLWPLFSSAGGARYFAAVVPLANAVRLAVAASGEESEKDLAKAVSRSGDAKEAIGGPFFYVLVLLASVLFCWRDNLTGMIAVSTMAAGDGLADIVGRRLGKGNKWFFNEDKSIAGSLAFTFGASSCSLALACWFAYTDTLPLPMHLTDLAVRILCISVISAMIELVPGVDDNWSVPLSAAMLSTLLIN